MANGQLLFQALDRDLSCEREAGSLHDPKAMPIKKVINGNLQVVGDMLRKISSRLFNQPKRFWTRCKCTISQEEKI